MASVPANMASTEQAITRPEIARPTAGQHHRDRECDRLEAVAQPGQRLPGGEQAEVERVDLLGCIARAQPA
jgi:hypothetical protein